MPMLRVRRLCKDESPGIAGLAANLALTAVSQFIEVPRNRQGID